MCTTVSLLIVVLSINFVNMVVAAGSVHDMSISWCICRCMFACPKGCDLKGKAEESGHSLLFASQVYFVNLS